jgi:hypothetical protein
MLRANEQGHVSQSCIGQVYAKFCGGWRSASSSFDHFYTWWSRDSYHQFRFLVEGGELAGPADAADHCIYVRCTSIPGLGAPATPVLELLMVLYMVVSNFVPDFSLIQHTVNREIVLSK